MSTVATKCPRCGRTAEVEAPEGDGPMVESLRRMATALPCDECVDRERERLAVAERAQKMRERLEASGVPKGWRLTLDQVEPLDGQPKAIAAATDWARTKDAGGLMLLGAVGTGKTQIATAACLSRLGISSCRYASVAGAMTGLEARFDDDLRRKAVAVFAGAGPIVLDDLDKGRISEYGIEHLFSAVDNRYQSGAPLLVTTNLTPSQIGQKFGDSIMSRLVGYCRVVEVAGGDHRLGRPELRAA